MIKGLDNEVYLDPGPHKYFNRAGEEYMSASKFLSLFKQPFDPRIADNCAGKGDYVGMTPDEVRTYWSEYGEERAGIGTVIHNACELFSETTQILPENEHLRPALLNINSQYKDYYRCYNEVILHDDTEMIAGTADRIIVTTSHKDSLLYISDYKTNEKGLPQIDLDKKGQPKNKFLLGPLSHMIESKFNLYCCQLNLYAYILNKQTDRRIGKLFIHYINPNNPLINYHIPVPIMRYEIIEMLKWRRENAIPIQEPGPAKSLLSNFGSDFLNNEM